MGLESRVMARSTHHESIKNTQSCRECVETLLSPHAKLDACAYALEKLRDVRILKQVTATKNSVNTTDPAVRLGEQST